MSAVVNRDNAAVTRRPRSHQIETESRNALRAAIPSAWTVERIVNDYGIDERVEIFDREGRATGEVFYVQLKATDVVDERRALQVRIRHEHFDYWNRLSDPVLLVLWHVPTKSLYWHWAHHHHPYDGLGHRDGVIQPSLTVRFTPRGLWNASDPEQLVAEVKFLRKVSAGALHLPLTIGVTSNDRHPLTATPLQSVVEKMSAEVDGRALRWVAGVEVPGRPHLYVGDAYLELRVGRLILSMNREPAEKVTPGAFHASLPTEVAAIVGLALCESGSTSAGFELLSGYGTRSAHLHHWTNLDSLLLEAIMHTGRYEIAVSLIEAWQAAGTTEHAGAALRLAQQLYRFYGRLPDELLVRLEANLERLAPDGSWREEPQRAALALLANGAYDEALATFQRLLATSDDNEIAMAGAAKAAFRGDHFAVAEGLYERLLARRDGDVALQLNLARCKLMLGRYRDALAIYDAVSDPARAGEIRTARIAVKLVVELAGDDQERQPSAAEQISREARDRDSDQQLFERFSRSLSADAVSPNTWRLYALLVLRQSPLANLGSLVFNVTAFFSLNDVEWFVIAATEAWRAPSPAAFALAVEYGLERFRERFISATAEVLGREEATSASLLALVEAMWTLKKSGLAFRTEVREGDTGDAGQPVFCIQGSETMPESRPIAKASE